MSADRIDRRRHRRFDIACPISLLGENGRELAAAKATNVSDSGAFVTMDIRSLPPCNAQVKLKMSLPRSAPNTYMLEKIACAGTVLRHQPMKDERFAGVAIQFVAEQQLAIEV